MQNPNPKPKPKPPNLKPISGYNATRNTKLSPEVNGDPRSNKQKEHAKAKNKTQFPIPNSQNPKPTLNPKSLQTQNNPKPNMSNASSQIPHTSFKHDVH